MIYLILKNKLLYVVQYVTALQITDTTVYIFLCLYHKQFTILYVRWIIRPVHEANFSAQQNSNHLQNTITFVALRQPELKQRSIISHVPMTNRPSLYISHLCYLFLCSQRHWESTRYFRFWIGIVAATTNCLPLLELEL